MANPPEPIICYKENKPVIQYLLYPYSEMWAVLQW